MEVEKVPYHLLCKSHCVEGLDNSNIKVLAEIELNVNMADSFIGNNPNLRSWFRGEKAVVIAGIKCLLNLISHQKIGRSSNLSEEFDIYMECNEKKHLSIYQERRFAKLGIMSASLLEVLPTIRKLLEETHLNNLHVTAARLYTECEFFETELELLAFFGHNVNFQFLNMVEKTKQSNLLEILPKLYKDLLQGKVSTLSNYVIKSRRLQIPTVALSSAQRDFEDHVQ